MRIKHNSIIWYPLVISIAIVLGIVIGNYISTKKFTLDKDRKINAVLNLIQSEYVDSIDVKDLVEQAIPAIIGNLDPHSYYIPASDIRAENEKLDGSLSGIGVSFFMMNDTANVDQVIPNGPAEKVGMLAGDRIISVNGESIVGGTLTAEGIRSKIRGEKGTKVKIGVKRNSSKKTLTFTITRDDIPMNTVDVSYMLDDKTGYIKIAQFGKNTYDEFFAALSKLKKDGASRYIVDLRGNPGGYMEMAILMVNEFLEQGELIVYTKGRKEREDIQVWSDDQGSFHDAQVAVLIDEYSASASEITSGALQDLDRAVVMGTRTYGKGLVQMPNVPLPYAGKLKLTTAKYYIPSGRCIQARKYKHTDNGYVAQEVADSLTHEFRTARGRIVRDGGGIKPDVEVKADSLPNIAYYLERADTTDVMLNYEIDYMASHPTVAKPADFEVSDADYEAFKQAVLKSGFTYDQISEKYLKDLEDLARFEGYYNDAKDEFEALKKKLQHNIEKDLDYAYNKKKIKEMLAADIMAAYYFEGGMIENSLRYDNQYAEAAKLLTDKERYEKLLQPTPEEEKAASENKKDSKKAADKKTTDKNKGKSKDKKK